MCQVLSQLQATGSCSAFLCWIKGFFNNSYFFLGKVIIEWSSHLLSPQLLLWLVKQIDFFNSHGKGISTGPKQSCDSIMLNIVVLYNFLGVDSEQDATSWHQ